MVSIASVAPIIGETIDPRRRSSECFAHYSIPAFDEGRVPVLEDGSEIKSNKTAFPYGAVLFSKLNPRISRVWHVTDVQDALRICSTEFLALSPDPSRCDAHYLQWVLRAPSFIGSIAGPSAATKSRERIKPADLTEGRIPLPSLPEQRRIANRLDAAMADIAGARTALVRQKQQLIQLRDVFASRLFSKVGYEVGWSELGVASPVIDYGVTASAEDRAGVRFLRITDITDSGVEWASVPGCTISAADTARKALRAGDIVVARTGGTVGKSFLVESPPESVFASYLVRVRASQGNVPKYLYEFMQSSLYWKALRSMARGGAQPNVNATLLKQLPIPLPSSDRQEQVVVRLSALDKKLTVASTALDRQVAALDALGPVLLNAAFQGQL